MNKSYLIKFWIIFSCCFLMMPLAFAGALNNIQIKKYNDYTRIIFFLTKSTTHHIFSLSNPSRLVVDFDKTTLRTSLSSVEIPNPVIKRLRSGNPVPNVLRIVFDMHEVLKYKQYFSVNNVGEAELVLDLYSKEIPKPVTLEKPVTPSSLLKEIKESIVKKSVSKSLSRATIFQGAHGSNILLKRISLPKPFQGVHCNNVILKTLSLPKPFQNVQCSNVILKIVPRPKPFENVQSANVILKIIPLPKPFLGVQSSVVILKRMSRLEIAMQTFKGAQSTNILIKQVSHPSPKIIFEGVKSDTLVSRIIPAIVPVAPVVTKTTSGLPRELPPIIVAIDPGHGGKDPGTIGMHGTREKDVVLAIALRLAQLIDNEPRMRAVLTREGDYFVNLRDRRRVARKDKADIFISIHADSYLRSRLAGVSVFSLSRHGATTEAAHWLANEENNSELGGVAIGEVDKKSFMLRSVLLDLSQTATINDSLDLGTKILNDLGKATKLHCSWVQQAPFVVLKSPDMPSVLIETGFLSNPQEEEKLQDKNYREKLAQAILQGIRNYWAEKSLA